MIPLSQNFFAVANPKPEFPPVTIAVFLLIIFKIYLSNAGDTDSLSQRRGKKQIFPIKAKQKNRVNQRYNYSIYYPFPGAKGNFSDLKYSKVCVGFSTPSGSSFPENC